MGGDRTTVLIVDDDAAVRLLCRVNLEDDGYRVVEAASGREVDAQLAASEVGVVLLDLRLGSEDGASIGERLRATRPDLRIVLLTAATDSAGRENRLGFADQIVTKPFSLDELLGAVRIHR